MYLQRYFRATITLILINFCALSTHAQERQTPTPEPPKIIRKSGGVLQASATNRVDPIYPPFAKSTGVSGPVIVEVIVDETGKVIVARSILGHLLLRDAAVEAAWAWSFRPTQLSGVPVKVIGRITFTFILRSSESAKREIESLNKQIESIKKEILAKIDLAENYYKLGLAYLKLGGNKDALQEAIESFKAAIAIKPDYTEAHYNLGLAYLKRYSQEDARKAFKQLINLRPDLAMAYYSLGEACSHSLQRDEAIESLKQAIKLKPDYAEAYYLLAWNYNQARRYKEGLETLKQASNADPNWAEVHLALGLAYLQAGDKDLALNEYRILKASYPHMAAHLLKRIEK